MTEVTLADNKFKSFREELVQFRGDLKDYYAFFVAQVESIAKHIQDNQIFNNSLLSELK